MSRLGGYYDREEPPSPSQTNSPTYITVRSVMAIGERVLHFQNKASDLGTLQLKIQNYLTNQGFSTPRRVVRTVPSSRPGRVGS